MPSKLGSSLKTRVGSRDLMSIGEQDRRLPCIRSELLVNLFVRNWEEPKN